MIWILLMALGWTLLSFPAGIMFGRWLRSRDLYADLVIRQFSDRELARNVAKQMARDARTARP